MLRDQLERGLPVDRQVAVAGRVVGLVLQSAPSEEVDAAAGGPHDLVEACDERGGSFVHREVEGE